MHRASPLALLKSASIDALQVYAMTDAKLTHFDPIAGECSKFVVLTCRHLLDGASVDTSLSLAYDAVSSNTLLKAELGDVLHFDKARPHLNKPLSNIGYSPDVLRATIYMLKTNDTFEATLNAAFTFAGAENYCPVVVGAIAGTYYGYPLIPQGWQIRHKFLQNDLATISQNFIDDWIIKNEKAKS